MAGTLSREIRLRKRPFGMPSESDFDLAEVSLPDPGEGEVLVRNIFMSVDPYMRGRMNEGASYIPPFEIGRPLEGGCVGEVVASGTDRFRTGDYVLGMKGWREFFLSDGSDIAKIDPGDAPVQSYLGVLGMPGMTAYVGLLEIGQPKTGDTVLVSAASGAVGATACQIARLRGCRVVGSAGSDEKVAWLLHTAGIDSAFNHRKVRDLGAELSRHCPNGIDVTFENVGGEHLRAALDHMNLFGRVVLCGMISQYNSAEPPPGPGNLFLVVLKRLTLRGFIVTDHMDKQDIFHADMSRWIRGGKIRWKETIFKGIENAPRAFLGLFKGDNFGKMLVRLADER